MIELIFNMIGLVLLGSLSAALIAYVFILVYTVYRENIGDSK